METIDQPSREQFARELDRNFSVTASAGSGQTRAITDRIVEIARDRRALDWLAKLVVVTYTNRAADEMRQRMELSRKYVVDLAVAQPKTPCPDASFEEVYAASNRRAKNIPKAQANLRRWEKRWRDTDEFVPWPPCASTAKEFVRVWREAF